MKLSLAFVCFVCFFFVKFSFALDSLQDYSQGLVAYFPFTENFENVCENTKENYSVENYGATLAKDRFGHENSAVYFNGKESYLEISDHDDLSIVSTGALTISVWVSPEVLNFELTESGGYVHWMGKGTPSQHEWVFRMYNKDLTETQDNRPNRMSAYAFNLQGGLGSGSYVQESLTENEWIHFVARYDVASNTITLFKNGIQKDEDALYDETYGVQVQNGSAPLRLGTRSLWSYFQGRIDDLRIYNRALSESEIVNLFNETDSEKKEDSLQDSTVLSISKKQSKKQNHFQNSLKQKNHSLYVEHKEQIFDLKGRKFK